MRLIAVLLAILVCSSAYSGERDDENRASAKRHYEAGEKAFRLGDFDTAIHEFRAAYERVPTPLLLYNLAQAWRQKGDAKQALFFYKQFVSADTTGAEHTAALQRIKELEELIDKEQKAKEAPPEGPSRPTVAAPATTTTATATGPTTATPTSEGVPVYKKWWLWATVGGVALAAVAVGLGVGLTAKGGSGFDASLGTTGPRALVQW